MAKCKVSNRPGSCPWPTVWAMCSLHLSCFSLCVLRVGAWHGWAGLTACGLSGGWKRTLSLSDSNGSWGLTGRPPPFPTMGTQLGHHVPRKTGNQEACTLSPTLHGLAARPGKVSKHGGYRQSSQNDASKATTLWGLLVTLETEAALCHEQGQGGLFGSLLHTPNSRASHDLPYSLQWDSTLPPRLPSV